ncbi:MAG TPA: hypothetical protein ACFYD6_09135 [Candidatus Brocadiia bacterium]|nr:outer membrane protein assembly factor BamC [Planctomycetota bacterium]MDO8094458.1 outer membrane protein assembly factor BamC [Candidatus Brocadiales bacterium]
MFYKAVGARCNVPLLILFVLQGCATTPARFAGEQVRYERTFSADYDAVWSATMDALVTSGIHVKEENKETGEIYTEWVEEQPVDRGGLFFGVYWIERYRFIISVIREGESATRLTVLCLVEEKTKGGTRSLRWVMKKSSGELEQQLLDKIEKILANQ